MSGQWTKGKSADSFAPMGPWLSTADETADPQKLRLWCRVNGDLRQNSWTGDMIFSVRQPRYLQAGDFVECGVESLGGLAQRVVAFR
jgi:2,4-didehydro-3-deoxy-L-rhamnonate hydrolase